MTAIRDLLTRLTSDKSLSSDEARELAAAAQKQASLTTEDRQVIQTALEQYRDVFEAEAEARDVLRSLAAGPSEVDQMLARVRGGKRATDADLGVLKKALASAPGPVERSRLEDAFLRANVAAGAAEKMWDAFGGARDLDSVELELAKASMEAREGRLGAAGLEKLLVRIHADGSFSSAEKRFIERLRQLDLPQATRAVLERWHPEGTPIARVERPPAAVAHAAADVAVVEPPRNVPIRALCGVVLPGADGKGGTLVTSSGVGAGFTDLDSGEITRGLEQMVNGNVKGVAYSAATNTVVTAWSNDMLTDGGVAIWAGDSKLPVTLSCRYHAPLCLSLSQDQTLAAMGSFQGDLLVYDLERNSFVTEIKAHKKAVTGVAHTPDGASIATVGRDSYLRLWDSKTKALQAELPLGSPATCLAMRPDGRELAVGLDDGKILRFDLSHDPPVALDAAVAGHGQSVKSLCYSGDCSLLASAGLDGKARLWDASDAAWRPMGEPFAAPKASSLAFARGDSSLVMMSFDGTKEWSLTRTPGEGVAQNPAVAPQKRLLDAEIDRATSPERLRELANGGPVSALGMRLAAETWAETDGTLDLDEVRALAGMEAKGGDRAPEVQAVLDDLAATAPQTGAARAALAALREKKLSADALAGKDEGAGAKKDGSGNVVVWQRANELDSEGKTVRVAFVHPARVEKDGIKTDRVHVSGNKLVTSIEGIEAPPAGKTNDAFDQVQALWLADTFLTRLEESGLDTDRLLRADQNNGVLRIYVNASDDANACYRPASNTLAFGTGYGKESFAADGDAVLHEMTHWLIDKQNSRMLYEEGRAIHEGIADAVAGLFFDDPEIAEAAASVNGEAYLRTLENDLTLKDAGTECHARGRAYGGFVWSLYQKLTTELHDQAKARQLVFSMVARHGDLYPSGYPTPGHFVSAMRAAATEVFAEVGDAKLAENVLGMIEDEAKKRQMLSPA